MQVFTATMSGTATRPLIGAQQSLGRHLQAERLRGLEVDDRLG
jgi:hypothetical protein